MNQFSSSMASLLKTEMRRQLNRLDSSDRDKAIRKALANKRRSQGSSTWVDLDLPCPWWSPSNEAEHRAWLAAPAQAHVPWEELDPCRQWVAGTPVRLRTGDHEHVAWVRLEGFCFTPRWLRGSIGERCVSPVELSTRNPRHVWSDPFKLQLAQALLSAEGDARCAWAVSQ